jgi:hypothetical protein
MGNNRAAEKGVLMTEKEFNEFLDYLDEYWSLFGPMPPCTETKVIKVAVI